jgi:hypothetical protein
MMLRVLAHERGHCFHGLNFRTLNKIRAARLRSLVETRAVDFSDPPPIGCWHKSQDGAVTT